MGRGEERGKEGEERGEERGKEREERGEGGGEGRRGEGKEERCDWECGREDVWRQ